MPAGFSRRLLATRPRILAVVFFGLNLLASLPLSSSGTMKTIALLAAIGAFILFIAWPFALMRVARDRPDNAHDYAMFFLISLVFAPSGFANVFPDQFDALTIGLQSLIELPAVICVLFAYLRIVYVGSYYFDNKRKALGAEYAHTKPSFWKVVFWPIGVFFIFDQLQPILRKRERHD